MQLTFEDGVEKTCTVLGVYQVDETDYIALLPEGDDGALIYRYIERGDEVDLQRITDDEEYDVAGEAFMALFGADEDEPGDEGGHDH